MTQSRNEPMIVNTILVQVPAEVVVVWPQVCGEPSGHATASWDGDGASVMGVIDLLATQALTLQDLDKSNIFYDKHSILFLLQFRYVS